MNMNRVVSSMVLMSVVTTVNHGAEVATFLEPYRDVDVASPEMGTLASVRVREGDVIERGQILATLDQAVLNASMDVARAAMEARGKLQSAEVELRLQSERLKKLEGLRRRQHASDEELNKAKAQQEIARSQVQAVQEELDVKTAEFARIKAQLELKRIRSPIDGTVTILSKDPGEFVSPTDPVVAKVVQLDPLLAVFSVPLSDARALQADQQVALHVGLARTLVKGKVEFVSPTVDPQSATVRVKVRIPNASRRLQSGDGCWLQVPDGRAGSKAPRPGRPADAGR